MYTVCPLVFGFSVRYCLDLTFFENLQMKISSPELTKAEILLQAIVLLQHYDTNVCGILIFMMFGVNIKVQTLISANIIQRCNL